MSRTIEYGNLMHDAMRGLIRKVLLDVAANGLPGNHHFFITFDKLEVTDEGFSVTLNFGDAPEPMYIPYDAIRTFVDPSVEFGLKFEQQEPSGDDGGTLPQKKESELEVPEEAPKAAEIVSLDSFRK